MINISDKFKTAMKEPIKELDAYVLLEDGTKISSGDDLISFKISGETSMCKTAMRKVECKYTGNHNLLDKWVHFFLGVKIDDGTFEYLDYGLFQINEMATSKDTGETSVTGYDLMIKSMIEYSKLDVTYPITLFDFTNRLVEACGLELKNTSFIANNNFLINNELYSNISGITYRDIFVQIAEATGTTCIISEDKVYFKHIFETNEELTYDNMFTLKLENKYGEINSVVLARTPQEDNIYLKDDESIELNGLTEFKIENNEIVDKNRETAIIDIYGQLAGISYYPFETTTEGLGWYEIADSFVIKNENDEEFKTVLFNFSISVDGSIKETLKTSETSSTKTQYQYATSIAKTVRNTELIVDKQNGEIKSIVDEIGDRTSKSTSITQDLDSISERVSLQQNLTNIVKKTSYVDTEDAYEGNLLYLSIHGQMSLLYPSDDLYPGDDLYPLDSYLIIEYSDNTQKKIKLPINWLNYLDDNTYDEFVLEENKAKIIRRVGENEDGSFYKLDNEVLEDYGDLVIPVKTGYNKLWLESFYDLKLNYEIRYVIKSDYTDIFATEYYVDNSIDISEKGVLLQSKQYTDNKTEDLSSEIKLHANEIVLKVDANDKIVKAALTADANQGASFTIDADQVDLTANDILNLIAGNEINLTSKNLSINSTNFKVDNAGNTECNNLTCTNGTFKGDIFLPSGGKVIGGDGMRTLLKFDGSSRSYSFLGCSMFTPIYFSGVNNLKDSIEIDFDIPNKFTVTSAYIKLEHIPTINKSDSTNLGTGYCRNLKLYKNTSQSAQSVTINWGYYESENNSSFSEVSGAFGSNGFTGNSSSYTSINSIDLKSYIQTGNNVFKIETGDSYNQDEIYNRNGSIRAELYVYGYMSE